jgi:hypothetical protein
MSCTDTASPPAGPYGDRQLTHGGACALAMSAGVCAEWEVVVEGGWGGWVGGGVVVVAEYGAMGRGAVGGPWSISVARGWGVICGQRKGACVLVAVAGFDGTMCSCGCAGFGGLGGWGG